MRARQPKEHQREQLQELRRDANRQREDAWHEPAEPRGRRRDEPQVDVRVGHDLLARGRTRVRHDVHFQRRLVRERQRVVLHARRATKIAKHHNLHATPRPGGRA